MTDDHNPPDTTFVDEVPDDAREAENPVEGAETYIRFAPDVYTLEYYTVQRDGRIKRELFRQVDDEEGDTEHHHILQP